MSKYLKTPDDLLTTKVLFKTLHNYVLDELKPIIDFSLFPKPPFDKAVNGEEIIQKVLDNSKNKLRMYGSAKELAEEVKIYRDFPFNIKFFNRNDSPFFSSAVIYENLKGKQFISNMDVLIIIQNMALEIFPKMVENFASSVYTQVAIQYPLRDHEVKNVTTLKFFEFDEKIFEEIENEMREAAKNCNVSEFELIQFDKQLAERNFTDFLKKVNPTTLAEETDTIKFIEDYFTLSRNNRGSILPRFLKTMSVKKCIESLIERKLGFLSGNGVSFVRVFEDGSERFVQKAELFHAISNDVGRRFKEENELITTISMEDVNKIYAHRVKDIEFIRTPIIRANHQPTLVKGHFPKKFGTLAVDQLFDFFQNMIMGHKVFQRNLNPKWKTISDSFEDWFKKYFKPECKTPFFIQVGTNFSARFDLDGSLHPKDVRNAKIDGFTVQNLKNELVHLGLNRVFPEIGDHAESVYSAVDQIKKGQYLRTCDLFDAVFYCQLICFLDKVPKFKTFLHNQSGCGRVLGYNCEMCQKKKSEIQKTLELSSNEFKGIESSGNMKKEDTKMISFKEYEEMKMKILELEKEIRELKKDKSRSSIQIDNLNLDKLSIDSSIPTVSTNNIISECLICELELKTTGDTLKCPMCRTRFHSKCAMEYAKYGVQCPSCKETLQNSIVSSKF